MCQSETHGSCPCPAEDERRVTQRSGPRRLPRNPSYRQGGHSTEQRCGTGVRTVTLSTWGDLNRVATENVLPSWLVHLSTTIDLTTSLRTLFRLHCHERVFSCNATPHALPRNDRRISTVLSWRDRSHFAPDLFATTVIFSHAGHGGARDVAGTECMWKTDGPSWN